MISTYLKKLLGRINRSKVERHMRSITPITSKQHKNTCYLAGPMENCSDNGLGWRLEYRTLLEEIGTKCVIPNFEEAELIPNVEVFNHWKRYDLPKYIETMRKFIEIDLNFVLDTDFTIVRWEGERMSGTVGEVQHAYLSGVPCYLVTSEPLYNVPGWFLACFTKTFKNTNELIDHLKEEYKL